MTSPIPYSEPWLTEQEALAAAEVVRSGRLILGPHVRAFEDLLATFCQRRHVITTTSGTTALQLALQLLGVGPGWSVILPAYTWVATWNVVHWAGAEPILIDADPDTFCVDPDDFERALAACSHDRIALIPVHMFGYRVDPDWLELIEKTHDITILGDGCCAFGGLHRGQRCGSWTRTECLSFHPRKVVSCGEGGALLLDDDALAERARRLRDHGASRSDEQRRQTTAGGPMTPHFPEPGHNWRMTELQGAVGEVQMHRLDALLEGRRHAAARYDEALPARLPWLWRPPGHDDPGRLLTCYAPQVRLHPEAPLPSPESAEFARAHQARDQLMEALAAEQIAARPPMIHLLDQPFTVVSQRGYDFPGTRTIAALTLGLPFFPHLTAEAQHRVLDALARHAPAAS